MSRAKKIIIAIVIFLFVLAGAGYAGGVYYFSRHFLPGTVINNYDCSFKDIPQVSKVIQEQAKVYVLAVDEKDNGREKLTAEQVGLAYQPDNRLQEFLDNQGKWTWFLSFQGKYVLEKSECTVYDEEKLEQALADLRCMQPENVTPPSDASFRDTGESFEAVPEVEGNQLELKKTFSVISNAILEGKQEVDLEAEGCYLKPSVYESDPQFQKNLEQVNALTAGILTYDFGNESERVDRTVVINWLTQDENGDYGLDKALVAGYVKKLAEKYDAVGKDMNFRTYDGRQITISGGSFGWVIDQEKETEALVQDVMNGTIEVREPVYAQRGANRRNNGIGDTYLEIDLTAQRMVLYKNGALSVDTPVVTGDPARQATPTGCFSCGKKESPKYLEDEVKNVSFWIPFTENLGIHDAPWRDDFSADLFGIIGTEGGVDVPFDAARAVYEQLDEGDPIIIYQ